MFQNLTKRKKSFQFSSQVFTERDRQAYLFIEVGQPVHAFELITLKFSVENGGLRNVLACMDGGVWQTVALSKPRGQSWGHAARNMQRGTAAVFGLFVKHPCLREETTKGYLRVLLFVGDDRISIDGGISAYSLLVNLISFSSIPQSLRFVVFTVCKHIKSFDFV